MNTTRSAISGKVARMKLRRGVNPGSKGHPAHNKGKKMPGRKKAIKKLPEAPHLFSAGRPPPPPAPPDTPPPQRVGVFELKTWHCRFPVAGDRASTLFCGGERYDRLPYCYDHCRVAYAKSVNRTMAELELDRRRTAHMRRGKAHSS
jgi:hypothetical protein